MYTGVPHDDCSKDSLPAPPFATDNPKSVNYKYLKVTCILVKICVIHLYIKLQAKLSIDARNKALYFKSVSSCFERSRLVVCSTQSKIHYHHIEGYLVKV